MTPRTIIFSLKKPEPKQGLFDLLNKMVPCANWASVMEPVGDPEKQDFYINNWYMRQHEFDEQFARNKIQTLEDQIRKRPLYYTHRTIELEDDRIITSNPYWTNT